MWWYKAAAGKKVIGIFKYGNGILIIGFKKAPA